MFQLQFKNRMNNKILAIAITDYDDKKSNNLSNCKNDLENILKILTNKYQFDDIDFIFEKIDTTRKSLFNKLKFYFSNCLENENVLLLFSGHGQYDETLNITYWQPSDSDSDDSSTWFNLNDLMTFIKVSKAHHISIISDSCFSGAMFQSPLRGGGIEALNKKKSRIGFASGSIEPVSDGPKGKLSPFAKVLIDELKKNNIVDCPLSNIATNVILNFDAARNQTPTFAPLSNVGHEGGIFILKLKENSSKIPKDIEYLREKYGTLYIPISEKHLEQFETLKELILRKIEAVKKQDYLEARKIKDEEERIKSNFPKSFIDNFIEVNNNFKITSETRDKIKKLDSEILKFKEDLPKLRENIEKELNRLRKDHHQIYIGQTLYNIEDIDEIIEAIILEQSVDRAHIKYFSIHKGDFIKHFNIGLSNLYIFFKSIQGNSISDFFHFKEKELLEIFQNIYDSEVNFLLANSIDEIEFLIQVRNNELKLLNWIQNKH